MEITGVVLPSSEDELDKIKHTIKEISNSMARVEGEKSFQKEAIGDLSKTYNIPKQMLQKVVATYHKQNIEEERGKVDDMFYLYESLFK